jgi:hypothetical protein
MAEFEGPDLLSIKPVEDTEASRYVSAETHRWLRESVVIAEPVSRVGSAARGGRLRLRPDALRRSGRQRVSDASGTPRRVLRATLLIATVAALIVLLPGLLSNDGSVTQPPSAQAQILHRITTALARGPETILIQKTRVLIVTRVSGGQPPQKPFGPVTFLSIDEASRDGVAQASFSTSSVSRPGFEDLSAGNSLQIYDPNDDTIYETTLAGWEAAVQRSAQGCSVPKGWQGACSYGWVDMSSRDSTGPGQLSVFEQGVRQHLYRVAGNASVDGRSALELVPVRTSIKIPSSNGSGREDLGTVYVSPTTYFPIREVFRLPSTGSSGGTEPGPVTTTVYDWSEYRVLPATTENARLVSLVARHPHARIVHGADAYLRVSNNQNYR